MKIYLAGVPRGGSPGDCKRERVKYIISLPITFLLPFNR